MVSEICKAKDPHTCPYHGAVLRMYQAQATGDFEGYFTARTSVEDLQQKNWVEEMSQSLASVAIPDTKRLTESIVLHRSGQKLNAHVSSECSGRNCAIHNPSSHPLSDAPLTWRNKTMERKCDHGITHPDPDDLAFRIKNGANEATAGVHGCDGCCAAKTADTTDKTYLQKFEPNNSTYTPTSLDQSIHTDGEIYNELDVIDPNNPTSSRATTRFTRLKTGVQAGEPKAIRLQFNRIVEQSELQTIAGLVDYQYQVNVDRKGIDLSDMYRDTPYSVVFKTNPRDRNPDSLPDAFYDLKDELPTIFKNGSPLRKTDRAGVGTKGTRLVEGLDEDNLKFEFYVDDIQ